MRAMLRLATGICVTAAIASLTQCTPTRAPSAESGERALLRLEYLERAAQLPPLNLQSVELPADGRLGRFSPVVWHVRSALAPGREFFRPLPVSDVDLALRDTLTHTLEGYGFNLRGWDELPPLRLRVEVERLVLQSDEGADGSRGCDIALRFRVEENPSGVEVKTYRGEASCVLPGSRTALRGDEVVWAPRPGDTDPIAIAAVAATERFLDDSLGFWREPQQWRDGAVRISALP
jgi:hypothetical protein